MWGCPAAQPLSQRRPLTTGSSCSWLQGCAAVSLLPRRLQPLQNKLFFEKLWGQRAHTCSPGRFGQAPISPAWEPHRATTHGSGAPLRPASSSSSRGPCSSLRQENPKQELWGETVLILNKDLIPGLPVTTLKLGPKKTKNNEVPSSEQSVCRKSTG